MPLISVVMGAYNAAPWIARAVQSILSQEIGLEFIVVDDGSTDETPDILASIHDPRLRIVRQYHSGLTAALVSGCALATGAVIARQDADDVSLPGRLRLQAEHLASTGAVAVSCRTQFVGPEDEFLFETAAMDTARSEFQPFRAITSHGSVMFRRDAYELAGGYRSAFYFAQDIDLWLRLARLGAIVAVPEVLYRFRCSPDSITGTSRPEQVALSMLAAIASRQDGAELAETLSVASAIKPLARKPARWVGNYFIGSCLAKNGDPRAEGYLRAALRERPLHVLARWKLLTRHRSAAVVVDLDVGRDGGRDDRGEDGRHLQ